MIHINLLPHDRRNKRKTRGLLPAGFVLPREVIIGLIGGFIVLLVLWHIVLQVMIMAGYVQLKGQQARWEKVLPEKQAVDRVTKELKDRHSRIKAFETLKADNNISWAEKLQRISENMPRGIWLRQVTFENGELLIAGSSVSKHKVEMITVHGFVKELKESADFMKGFWSVELESIRNRQLGEISVADFNIRATLREKQ